jgi:hypothetical protein
MRGPRFTWGCGMGTATPKKAKGREGKVDVEVKDRG